jgi:hypothetical protein
MVLKRLIMVKDGDKLLKSGKKTVENDEGQLYIRDENFKNINF